MDQIEEIKRKIDIVEVISEHAQLKRAGRNFKGLCPFHSEKTPSFMVSPELQIFKCFGCETGGDVYRFLMEFEKIDFPRALKLLADRAGVKLRPLKGFQDFQGKEEIYQANHLASELYHYLLVSHKAGRRALEYLKGRGIKEATIKTFKIGFAPDSTDFAFKFLAKKRGYKPEVLERAGIAVRKEAGYFDRFRGRIVFPLRDHLGNVLGFSGRVIAERGDVAKYINTPETQVYKKGSMLYGLDVTKKEIKEEGYAVVVEGHFDLVSSWQAGVRNCVAVGGSALTAEQARLIFRFCPAVCLALDSDFAGNEAARRGIETAHAVGLEVRVVELGKYKDPDEAARGNPKFWKEAVGRASGVYDFLLDLAFSRFDPSLPEGKSKIGRELTPVLAGIGDEILKAHYIKRTAERLGVPEEAVFAQVRKQRQGGVLPEESTKPAAGPKQRREVLEEYLLSLVFQTRPVKIGEFGELVKTPAARRIVDEFAKKEKGEFDPSAFTASLPAELVGLFSSFFLLDIEHLVLSGKIDQELEKTKRSLEVLDIREKMDELARRIRTLEEKGETKEIAVLERELTQAGQELSLLEQAL